MHIVQRVEARQPLAHRLASRGTDSPSRQLTASNVDDRVRDLPTMHIQRTYDPHRDLLELRGLERPACSNTLVPRGSHHISSLWSPVVATGGNQGQIAGRGEPRKQAKSVATGSHRLPEKFHGKEGGRRFESVRGLCKSAAKRG